ncbi:hypothetical protein [Nitrosomonas sp. Is37]|nr:hypothetical protein [Nitrosomonas sp. Is37]MDV6343406.1 hypothetical protein [Nitrosomonas sp. Is37]
MSRDNLSQGYREGRGCRRVHAACVITERWQKRLEISAAMVF